MQSTYRAIIDYQAVPIAVFTYYYFTYYYYYYFILYSHIHILFTNKAPFGVMNEWEEKDVLKCVYQQLHVRSRIYPPSCVKCIASGSLITNQFSVQSIQPFPRHRKWTAHVCTCTFTPPLPSGKHLTNVTICKTFI